MENWENYLYHIKVEDTTWLLQAIGGLLVGRFPEPMNSWSVELLLRNTYTNILRRNRGIQQMDFMELPLAEEIQFNVVGRVDINGYTVKKNKSPIFTMMVLPCIHKNVGDSYFLEPLDVVIPYEGEGYKFGEFVSGRIENRGINDPWEASW